MGSVGAKDSIIVIEVMAIIGLITAVWRVSGTITIFIYYGIKFITPSLFLLIAFLLSCLLSYAIGTSFGVAGTVGVIFMALARSGGVDPILTMCIPPLLEVKRILQTSARNVSFTTSSCLILTDGSSGSKDDQGVGVS